MILLFSNNIVFDPLETNYYRCHLFFEFMEFKSSRLFPITVTIKQHGARTLELLACHLLSVTALNQELRDIIQRVISHLYDVLEDFSHQTTDFNQLLDQHATELYELLLDFFDWLSQQASRFVRDCRKDEIIHCLHPQIRSQLQNESYSAPEDIVYVFRRKYRSYLTHLPLPLQPHSIEDLTQARKDILRERLLINKVLYPQSITSNSSNNSPIKSTQSTEEKSTEEEEELLREARVFEGWDVMRSEIKKVLVFLLGLDDDSWFEPLPAIECKSIGQPNQLEHNTFEPSIITSPTELQESINKDDFSVKEMDSRTIKINISNETYSITGDLDTARKNIEMGVEYSAQDDTTPNASFASPVTSPPLLPSLPSNTTESETSEKIVTRTQALPPPLSLALPASAPESFEAKSLAKEPKQSKKHKTSSGSRPKLSFFAAYNNSNTSSNNNSAGSSAVSTPLISVATPATNSSWILPRNASVQPIAEGEEEDRLSFSDPLLLGLSSGVQLTVEQNTNCHQHPLELQNPYPQASAESLSTTDANTNAVNWNLVRMLQQQPQPPTSASPTSILSQSQSSLHHSRSDTSTYEEQQHQQIKQKIGSSPNSANSYTNHTINQVAVGRTSSGLHSPTLPFSRAHSNSNLGQAIDRTSSYTAAAAHSPILSRNNSYRHSNVAVPASPVRRAVSNSSFASSATTTSQHSFTSLHSTSHSLFCSNSNNGSNSNGVLGILRRSSTPVSASQNILDIVTPSHASHHHSIQSAQRHHLNSSNSSSSSRNAMEMHQLAQEVKDSQHLAEYARQVFQDTLGLVHALLLMATSRTYAGGDAFILLNDLYGGEGLMFCSNARSSAVPGLHFKQPTQSNKNNVSSKSSRQQRRQRSFTSTPNLIPSTSNSDHLNAANSSGLLLTSVAITARGMKVKLPMRYALYDTESLRNCDTGLDGVTPLAVFECTTTTLLVINPELLTELNARAQQMQQQRQELSSLVSTNTSVTTAVVASSTALSQSSPLDTDIAREMDMGSISGAQMLHNSIDTLTTVGSEDDAASLPGTNAGIITRKQVPVPRQALRRAELLLQTLITRPQQIVHRAVSMEPLPVQGAM